jgi:hypothetical protein
MLVEPVVLLSLVLLENTGVEGVDVSEEIK